LNEKEYPENGIIKKYTELLISKIVGSKERQDEQHDSSDNR
jgi:hypothetical protein